MKAKTLLINGFIICLLIFIATVAYWAHENQFQWHS
jgi:hypothetical protein